MSDLIETAKAHYRACFQAMAASVGNPWHLYRKPGTDNLMVCIEGLAPDGWTPIVCHVQAMTEARVVQRVHDLIRSN